VPTKKKSKIKISGFCGAIINVLAYEYICKYIHMYMHILYIYSFDVYVIMKLLTYILYVV
jgi:hypothetical protein